MIAALAIAAVFLVAGWTVYAKSRRAARLWAAAALAVLAAANGLAIAQSPGPWWPLIERGWGAAEWFAVIVWIAALALIFRARQRGRRAGMVILACAMGAFAFGLVSAATGHSQHSGSVCLGKIAALGPWTANLRKLEPVVGADYTGLQAGLSLRFDDGTVVQAQPARRDYFIGGGSPRAGSATASRWDGALLVEVLANWGSPDCITMKLEFRRFTQWLRYGAWLSLVGALLLLVAALRSAGWRAVAWKRIAMRSEDRGSGGVPVAHRKLAWKVPVAIALACGLLGIAWQLGQRPPDDPASINAQRAAVDSAAMIAARQSLFAPPHLTNRWLVIADALMRHGEFGDAAVVLQGAVEKMPGDAEAWLAMGDALYGHAGGVMGSAAQLAYHRADGAAPLAAIAMARSGRVTEARRWSSRSRLPHQPGAP